MGRRRYAVPTHPVYSREYDRLKGISPFLNPRGFNEDLLQASHKDGIQSLILEWEGNKEGEHKGQFWNPMWGGSWQTSRLLNARQALETVDEEWEDIQVGATRSGRPVPKAMPAQLGEKKLLSEARLDITLEELDALKKELTKWTSKEKQAQDDNILKYGPRGSAKGEPPREIDGQQVIQKDGELFIDCPKSPYNGMNLPDYFVKVVHPFLKSRKPITEEEKKDLNNVPMGRHGGRAIGFDKLPPRPSTPPPQIK
jgi:hypothetical protein